MLRKYEGIKNHVEALMTEEGEGVSLLETNKTGECHRNKRSSENHETKEETSWNGVIGGILEDGRIYKRTDSKSR